MKNSLINQKRNYYIQFFTHQNGLDMIANMLQELNLKRDIEVLFFITGFRKHYVLSNQEEKKSSEFLEKLAKENFDGWLASIENRSHIEVAIVNDPNIFKMISFEPLRKN